MATIRARVLGDLYRRLDRISPAYATQVRRWERESTPAEIHGMAAEARCLICRGPVLARKQLYLSRSIKADYCLDLPALGVESLLAGEHAAGEWQTIIMTSEAQIIGFFLDQIMAPSLVLAVLDMQLTECRSR